MSYIIDRSDSKESSFTRRESFSSLMVTNTTSALVMWLADPLSGDDKGESWTVELTRDDRSDVSSNWAKNLHQVVQKPVSFPTHYEKPLIFLCTESCCIRPYK